MYAVIISEPTTISGFSIYLPSGSDTFCIGIYRGALLSSNSGNIVLVGKSASGTPSNITQTNGSSTFPFTRRAIVAETGQNLSFASGEMMTIGFHSSGSTTNYYATATLASTSLALAYNANANYSSGNFPSTLSQSSIISVLSYRLCFELY